MNLELVGGQTVLVGNLLSSPKCGRVARHHQQQQQPRLKWLRNQQTVQAFCPIVLTSVRRSSSNRQQESAAALHCPPCSVSWTEGCIRVMSRVPDPKLLCVPRNKMQDPKRNTKREPNVEFPRRVLPPCCAVLWICGNKSTLQ